MYCNVDGGFFLNALIVMNEAWEIVFVYLTFHGADAAIAFAELEVRGVEDLEGHLAAVAAAFVQHFCTHVFM